MLSPNIPIPAADGDWRHRPLSASTTPVEILLIIAALSSSVTPDQVITKVKRLAAGAQASRTIVFALVSAMSARSAIEKFMTQVGYALPEDWQITVGRADGGRSALNFSLFTLFGHMMCTLPDEAWTAAGLEFLGKYRASIGNCASILAFGANGVIQGKMDNKADGGANRGPILRKWFSIVSGFDMSPYRQMLYELMPELFNPDPNYSPGSVLANIVSPGLPASLSSPFSGAGSRISSAFATLKKVPMFVLTVSLYMVPFFSLCLLFFAYFGFKLYALLKSRYGVIIIMIALYFSVVGFAGERVKAMVPSLGFGEAPEWMTDLESATKGSGSAAVWTIATVIEVLLSSGYTSVSSHLIGGSQIFIDGDFDYYMRYFGFVKHLSKTWVFPWFGQAFRRARQETSVPLSIKSLFSDVYPAIEAAYDVLFRGGEATAGWKEVWNAHGPNASGGTPSEGESPPRDEPDVDSKLDPKAQPESEEPTSGKPTDSEVPKSETPADPGHKSPASAPERSEQASSKATGSEPPKEVKPKPDGLSPSSPSPKAESTVQSSKESRDTTVLKPETPSGESRKLSVSAPIEPALEASKEKVPALSKGTKTKPVEPPSASPASKPDGSGKILK